MSMTTTRKRSTAMSAVIGALAAAVACGGSSRRTLDSQEGSGSGRGGAAGKGNQGATGGKGAGAAGARAVGGTGGSGTSGRSAAGGSGLGGDAGGRPEQGGAGASAGQAGSGGLPSAAFAPPWLPTGAFGVAAQRVVEAATEYTYWLCATNGLEIAACTNAELHNFAPSLEWLACASRAPGADALLEQLASEFFACAAKQREQGGIASCQLEIPEVPGCPSYQSDVCPSGEPFAYRCDDRDSLDCGDGYDDRNCDPAALRYDCGDGGLIAWTAVCDGSPDCMNEVDEFRCGPTGGEGGAAGSSPDG